MCVCESHIYIYRCGYVKHKTKQKEEISFEDSYPDTTITYILKGNQIHAGLVSENTCINMLVLQENNRYNIIN